MIYIYILPESMHILYKLVRKNRLPIEKWVKYLNRHITKAHIQVINTYMKKEYWPKYWLVHNSKENPMKLFWNREVI